MPIDDVMPIYDDVMAIENGEGDDVEYFDSLQRAINAGLWFLQGSFGRSMMDGINAGECVLGRERFKDAYGNVVPSRYDVRAGTKGSFTYVQEHIGFAEADRRDKL